MRCGQLLRLPLISAMQFYSCIVWHKLPAGPEVNIKRMRERERWREREREREEHNQLYLPCIEKELYAGGTHCIPLFLERNSARTVASVSLPLSPLSSSLLSFCYVMGLSRVHVLRAQLDCELVVA